MPPKPEPSGAAVPTPAPNGQLAQRNPTAQANPDTNPLDIATDEAKDSAPADHDDVWERLRAQFSLSSAQDPRIERELAWYRAHPQYFARISARARPYLYFITEEVEKRGLPGEIALLPAVESSFEPLAYSPGHAAGIWQFIPSTGRSYGLKQTWWYDGRRDVAASTRAALEYLNTLRTRFDGNWELALASYNAGAGTVARAIRQNRREGRPEDFWSLDLPAETEVYVPRLLAIARVIADPAAFGINLEPIPNEPYFASVNIGSQIDLTLAAELADLSIEELYQLNPGLNRWATDPTGPHRLHLPVDKLETFHGNLVQLEPEERMRWQRYQVRPGDTLGSIAARHGTSVGEVQRANQLKGTRIRAGQRLLIPRPIAPGESDTPATQATAFAHTEYLVRPGDSLWTIARSHQVGHQELADWNGISARDPLQPGQRLLIREPHPVGNSLQKVSASVRAEPSAVSYRVRKGDSLYTIARRFRVSVANLKRWNELRGSYLQPGQKLVLYFDMSQQQAL